MYSTFKPNNEGYDKKLLHYYDSSEISNDCSNETDDGTSSFDTFDDQYNDNLLKLHMIKNCAYAYEEFICVIQLRSPSEEVGFSISETEYGSPYVEDLIPNTPAERSNLLEGDEIIEVNTIPLYNIGYYQVIDLIKESIDSCIIQLKIRRKLSLNKMPLSTTESQIATVLFSEDRRQNIIIEDTANKMSEVISPSEWERVKEYEDDLKRRREYLEIKEKQNNFMRTSIRASKRLQALENSSNSQYNNMPSPLIEEKDCNFSYSNKCYSPAGSTPRGSIHELPNIVNKDTNVSQEVLSHDSCDTNLLVVKVYKPEDDSYLGATVKNEGERVIVSRIIQGGICEKTKCLVEGDEIIEVNGNDIRGLSVNEVSDLLRRIHGDIIFIIVPSPLRQSLSNNENNLKNNRSSQKNHAPVIHHIRALFDYDPEDDYFVPCKELALKFQRGDILHVISTSDENWWQAYREGDDATQQLAGLIPSSSFQKQVEMYNRELDKKATGDGKSTKGKNLFKKKFSDKKKKKDKFGDKVKILDEEVSDNEILTYEDVCLYLSRSGRKRPVILCGPEGVGCFELRQKLIENDKTRFSCAIPHTTRPRHGNEVDGVDYHFVTPQQFSELSSNGMFVEYGEFQKHYYGTSVMSISKVISENKTCLLTLKPETLKSLRKTDLMPFVVFIAPPSLMQLKRQKDMNGQFGVRDEELKGILNEGKKMEQNYGHLFDHIIVNIEYQKSLEELMEIVQRLDTEPHWVPSYWLNNRNSTYRSNGKYNDRGRIVSYFEEEGKIPL
uniref:MAGUK p55 subfamily member 5 n=1 Tax=Strongyloides papillosus TaxID=174720 RepID=A0A0N5BRW5_STREA